MGVGVDGRGEKWGVSLNVGIIARDEIDYISMNGL
jgi:hypothetical protein